MRHLTRLVLALTVVVTTAATGCSALTENAIDAADAKLRLKWSEEWKPALLAEAKATGDEALKVALDAATQKIQTSVDLQVAKLDALGVTKQETPLATLKAALEANAQKPQDQQLPFLQLVMAVAAAYVPLTAAKEAIVKKRAT